MKNLEKEVISKKLYFGKVDYNKTGRKVNLIEVDIELKKEKQGYVFSASGGFWDNTKTDYICCGQCLDEIYKYKKHNKMFLEVYKFWQKYHLNNMNADCIHGRNEKLAKKELEIKRYVLKSGISKRQDYIKENVFKRLNEGNQAFINEEEKMILGLSYDIECEELPTKLLQYYDYKSSETKTAGWEECTAYIPNGVLSKPCPVCQYKYGTSWNFREIPKKDLKRIQEIINDPNLNF